LAPQVGHAPMKEALKLSALMIAPAGMDLEAARRPLRQA
jgi:hypothetical protein